MHLITFFVVLKINGNSEKMSKGVDRLDQLSISLLF
jgi:hypothetical protein